MRENDAGEEVSYNPPRYEFHYDFYIELTVDNPYFDDIRFKVNNDTVTLISELQSRSGGGVRQFLLQSGEFDPSYNPEYRQYLMMCEEISETIQRGQRGAIEQPREIVDPAAMTAQMEQKTQTLTEEAKAGATAAATSGTKVCPACNAEVTGKFCEYCGTKVE